LRRPLPGGAEVRTQRSYEIRFVPDGAGFRVEGALLDVAVDAPPALSALAALERDRPDADMFPMRLDAAGKLVSADAPATAPQVREAIRVARRQIGALGLERVPAIQADAFARQFESRSARTPWPEDLFNPASGQRRETRSIPLPNGAHGQVAIDIDAQTAGPTGLLRRFERRVTTQLDGSTRMTEEIWTLHAKG